MTRLPTSPESAPPQAPFPTRTAWSLILGAADRNSREWKTHFETLVQRYWKPVWWYLIRHWNCSREDAADLAQEFFAYLFEENRLQRASPGRGRFRTFLKLELKDLVVEEIRKRSAQKRGGRAVQVSIDQEFVRGTLSLQWPGLSPEEEFDRVWATCLLSDALEELRKELAAEGKAAIFRAFWNCVVGSPPKSYRECAEEMGIKVADVGNHIFRARGALMKILLRHVRESVEHEGEGERELNDILQLLERDRAARS